jgi:pimeloyl-ACP methyl ester carboxylesterase
MTKTIICNIIGVLVVLAVIYFKIPMLWVIIGVFLLLIFVAFNPFIPSVESIPKGFTEKQFNTGEIIINYVEGPDNGPPILFIPGQTEFWQGYKLVIPNFSKHYHVFVVDIRGHGKSTHTPGEYSYNIIGEDLKEFLESVIKKPAIVSGLSSGATLDKPNRDLMEYFLTQGIPKEGHERIFLIPAWIAKFIVGLFEQNKKFRTSKKYDIPLAPFIERVGFKFLSEYDVDFSKATIDGRLTEGFDPDSTLKRIKCPVLLIHASWSRHETWGLLGALDDKDAEKIRSTVKNLKYIKVNAIHDVHLAKPKIFIKIVNNYLQSLNM